MNQTQEFNTTIRRILTDAAIQLRNTCMQHYERLLDKKAPDRDKPIRDELTVVHAPEPERAFREERRKEQGEYEVLKSRQTKKLQNLDQGNEHNEPQRARKPVDPDARTSTATPP